MKCLAFCVYQFSNEWFEGNVDINGCSLRYSNKLHCDLLCCSVQINVIMYRVIDMLYSLHFVQYDFSNYASGQSGT